MHPVLLVAEYLKLVGGSVRSQSRRTAHGFAPPVGFLRSTVRWECALCLLEEDKAVEIGHDGTGRWPGRGRSPAAT